MLTSSMCWLAAPPSQRRNVGPSVRRRGVAVSGATEGNSFVGKERMAVNAGARTRGGAHGEYDSDGAQARGGYLLFEYVRLFCRQLLGELGCSRESDDGRRKGVTTEGWFMAQPAHGTVPNESRVCVTLTGPTPR